MIEEQREEFWRRFLEDIERFRDRGSDCEVVVNPFASARWRVKFTRRRPGYPAASVTLAILEHAPSRDEFLLALTPTWTVEGVAADGDRFLLPVFFDSASGTFSLQADHGPVAEAQIVDFFAGMTGALLGRL